MTKDVLLKVRGLQFNGDPEAEKVETITPAQYYLKNGGHYILYDEIAEGLEENTRNVIRIKDHELNIMKRGVINAEMLFTENRKNLTSYGTPYGSIMVGIDTNHMDVTEEEDLLRVHIDYALELNHEHFADCKLDIDVRPKEKGMLM